MDNWFQFFIIRLWELPAPLLVEVGHYCFPLAKAYCEFLAEKAEHLQDTGVFLGRSNEWLYEVSELKKVMYAVCRSNRLSRLLDVSLKKRGELASDFLHHPMPRYGLRDDV